METKLLVFTVVLNGTDSNPFERWGLSRNPFPKFARHELMPLSRALSTLQAEPMPRVEDLVATLERLGAGEEFRELCLRHYVAGQRTSFTCSMADDGAS